jgi:hypothetical protein
MPRADWAKLTAWLASQKGADVTMDWSLFNAIVGGAPASAINHYPQWWQGDRPNTRAWREAGFEVASVEPGRTVTFRRTGGPPPLLPIRSPSQHRSPTDLPGGDPGAALIILQCSADKAHGGQASPVPAAPFWTAELYQARQQLSAIAAVDSTGVVPAWRRYTGRFYENCPTALAEAVAQDANIVIISGGYGLVAAKEPIGWYDKIFKLTDWPPGCLQRALLHRVAQTRPASVVAFVSATTDYAKLIRKTPWNQAGIPVHLITRRAAQDGAMSKVPKTLAQAFNAYWKRNPGDAPADLKVEQLA